MTAEDKAGALLDELRSLACPANLEGMRRFGVPAELGVTMPLMRRLARRAGHDHDVAAKLWASGVHEARILATLVDEAPKVTEEQAERWVLDLRSWDLCDQWCMNLLRRTPLAWPKAGEWSQREEEMVRRAGFVLMAVLAVHDKEADDSAFEKLLPRIRSGSSDPRPLVNKAVSWALRQIGKRDLALNTAAIAAAEQLRESGDRSSRRVAAEALRELKGEAVQERLRRRADV